MDGEKQESRGERVSGQMYRSKKILFSLTCFAFLCIVACTLVWQNNASTPLPVLYLTIDDGEPLVEKEYSSASVALSYPDQVGEQTLSASIRQRGNSTLNYVKKSYKIKLDEKADLLLGGSESSDNAARDWILLANYYDRTSLRNTYTFFAASLLSGLEYTTESMMVEVYVNGEYCGIYQLCEEVEVDSARLDIDEKAEGDNGILLECRQSLEQEYGIGLLYGTTEFLMYDIRSDITSEAQVTRATELLTQAQDAIISGDQEAVAQIIDLDSCVDMYLLQEFVKNIDVGYSSFYLYIKEDEELIYLGPPWDFDISMGSNRNLDSYEGLYAAAEYSDEQQNPNEWFRDLMKCEWFQQRVQERWNEKKDVFLLALAEIQQTEEQYRTQLEINYAMWYAKEDQSEEDWQTAYQDDYTALYEWIENRYIWLDDYFNTMV